MRKHTSSKVSGQHSWSKKQLDQKKKRRKGAIYRRVATIVLIEKKKNSRKGTGASKWSCLTAAKSVTWGRWRWWRKRWSWWRRWGWWWSWANRRVARKRSTTRRNARERVIFKFSANARLHDINQMISTRARGSKDAIKQQPCTLYKNPSAIYLTMYSLPKK